MALELRQQDRPRGKPREQAPQVATDDSCPSVVTLAGHDPAELALYLAEEKLAPIEVRTVELPEAPSGEATVTVGNEVLHGWVESQVKCALPDVRLAVDGQHRIYMIAPPPGRVNYEDNTCVTPVGIRTCKAAPQTKRLYVFPAGYTYGGYRRAR